MSSFSKEYWNPRKNPEVKRHFWNNISNSPRMLQVVNYKAAKALQNRPYDDYRQRLVHWSSRTHSLFKRWPTLSGVSVFDRTNVSCAPYVPGDISYFCHFTEIYDSEDDSLQKGRSKVGLIYVLIRRLSGRMPLTFNSVKNLCLASGYSLSLFVGTPINVYIIYRLSSKDVKKSNYFRLLILMCLIDVYQAVFGELDFWGEIIFDDFEKIKGGLRLAYLINGEILTDTYSIQSFLCLIVVIHWKTVMKSRPRVDKTIYTVATMYFTTMLALDIGYEYYPMFTTQSCIGSKQLCKMVRQLLNFCEIIYMLFFSFVSIFCIVSIRRVNTNTYSAHTLKLYKRVALVHFIQCALSMVELAYHHIGTFVISEMQLSVNWKSALINEIDDIHYYTDLMYQITRPFVRAIFLAWALKNMLSKVSQEPRTIVQP